MRDSEPSPVYANQVSAQIDAAVGNVSGILLEVSHAIHDKPELAFEEHFACELLAQTLRDHDLEVETGVYSLETAFATRYPAFEAMLASEDAREGRLAFLQKRHPKWRGR